MRSARFAALNVFIAMTLLAGLATSRANARTIISSLPSAAEVRAEQLRLLSPKMMARQTLRHADLGSLILEVAGRPGQQAFLKYGGSFRRYWQASQAAFAGKGFEAIVAFRENQLRSITGQTNRLLVTAAEGLKGHCADLVDMAPDGTIVALYQCKMGARAAQKAISNPKYAGMKILTTPESLDYIKRELLRRQVHAMNGGRVLSGSWSEIAEGLATGRLTDRIARGVQAVSRRDATRLVRHAMIRQWRAMSRAFPRMNRLLLATVGAGSALEGVITTYRLVSRSLLLIDCGADAYATWVDVHRYRSGEISADYLAFKCSLRGAQLGLLAYTIAGPTDPLSKALAAAGVIALTLADLFSDPIYEHILARQQLAALRLMESLEHKERAHAIRNELLRQIQSAAIGS